MGLSYLELKKYSDALTSFNKAIRITHCEECVTRAWFMLSIAYLLLFIDEGIKSHVDSAIKNLKESINCLSNITVKDEIFNSYARAFKNIIEAKKIDVIKAALKMILETDRTDLLVLLSPYLTLIKYLDTKDIEIIDRLRHEERIVVEDMLRMLGEKPDVKAKKE